MRFAPLLFLSAFLCLLAPGAALADEAAWTTAKGIFRVSYTPDTRPVPLNRIHHWTFHLETAAGEPVANALLTVDGGMPSHNHGLPTRPRQTDYLGGGDYLVEGLRFHMPGEWEIRLEISAGELSDSVSIPLRL